MGEMTDDSYMGDHDHGKHRDGPCPGCEREDRERGHPTRPLRPAEGQWTIHICSCGYVQANKTRYCPACKEDRFVLTTKAPRLVKVIPLSRAQQAERERDELREGLRLIRKAVWDQQPSSDSERAIANAASAIADTLLLSPDQRAVLSDQGAEEE